MKTVKKVESPIRVGEAVFIRTVTYHYTGRIVGLTATEILLEDVAWIADSGRWNEARMTGILSEVEPYPAGVVSVARAAVVDVSCWGHALPRTAK